MLYRIERFTVDGKFHQLAIVPSLVARRVRSSPPGVHAARCRIGTLGR
jgi:hypothetical protein